MTPRSCSQSARWAESVDLPTPPLVLVKTISIEQDGKPNMAKLAIPKMQGDESRLSGRVEAYSLAGPASMASNAASRRMAIAANVVQGPMDGQIGLGMNQVGR